jgi:intein/homing endonuclease
MKPNELWVYLDELKPGDYILIVIEDQVKVLRMVEQ